MMNGHANEGSDRVIPGTVRWDMGIGSEHHHDIVWRCDGMRAGKLYSRIMFGSREEAEQFAQKMRRNEPDQMFSVESVAASSVWN